MTTGSAPARVSRDSRGGRLTPVLAIAEGRARALGRQGSPPGGCDQEWHPRDPDPDEEQQEGADDEGRPAI